MKLVTIAGLSTYFFTLALAAAPSPTPSPTPTPSQAPSASPTPAIQSREEGDRLFRNRNNEASARKALEIYKANYQAKPKDNENVWRYSVALYHMGFKVEKDDKKKREYFTEGKKITEEAIQNDANCAACHFWHAIHSALEANESSSVNLLVNINYVRRFAIRSTELDPTCTKAGGYRLLGQVEIGLPGILGGSNRRAKEYFEKAIAAVPQEPMNYWELAKHLDKNMDKPEEAIEVAKKGAVLAKPEAHDYESLEAWNQLQDFLKDKKVSLSNTPKPSPSPSVSAKTS
ncbi:MAG: hypothetical protein JNL01_14605 [Bdellovibrionales bacterium]|nr:hypothetical protein [Bdellovibrionales bacterium]